MEKFNLSDQSKSTIKALKSKSKCHQNENLLTFIGEYVHKLADKSVAQILSHQRPSPGNMYFSNAKSSAADLEQELTNRLNKEGTRVTSRTIKHASKTFDEIISQDVHFGTLLTKIKRAYESYINSKWGNIKNEDDQPSYEELQAKVLNSDKVISEKVQIISKLEKELVTMKTEMEKVYMEEIKTKDSIIHDLKARIDTLDIQLTSMKKDNTQLQEKLQAGRDESKDMEIKNLIHDNTFLNDEWLRLKDQWDYLKYFYDTLNTAVYPVQELYDNIVKNIPTTRFGEFTNSQKPPGGGHPIPQKMPGPGPNPHYIPFPPVDAHSKPQEEEPEPVKKSDFSFHLDDSYEDLPRSEVKFPRKPSWIPSLCFEGLPEYETSSEEDNDQQYPQDAYQNGYDYINNFYKKMDQENHPEGEEPFDLSSQGDGKQTSHKKSLMYSKTNPRSSSADMRVSESFN